MGGRGPTLGALAVLGFVACARPAPAPLVLHEPCPIAEPKDTLLDLARARASACAGPEAVSGVDPHLLLFVAAGFGDVFDANVRSLDFRTEVVPTAQAQALACLVPDYNVPFGGPVSAAMAGFRGEVSGWQVGRENSPVVYVELPYWTNQREGGDPVGQGERIDEAATAALVARLRTAFVDGAHASEFGVERNTVRMWWD